MNADQLLVSPGGLDWSGATGSYGTCCACVTIGGVAPKNEGFSAALI
jgi:hypothetical protein